MKAPVDAAVRERAISALDVSMALSAGAGSGKTSVLTARVARLLLGGAEPTRVAAVTFTEKAAAELRLRVRDRLEQALREGHPGAARALERLHALHLGTLHAFCRQLLLTESLQAGFPPGTTVGIESEGVQRALGPWRRRLHHEAPLLCTLLDRMVTANQLRNAATALLGARDLAPAVSPRRLHPAAAHAALVVARDALEMAADQCRAPDDALLVKNADLRRAMARWAGMDPIAGVLDALSSPEAGSLQHGRGSSWAPAGKELMKGAVELVRGWRSAWLEAAHGELVRSMARDLLPATLVARSQLSAASFDDLLFRASDLLDDPTTRVRLASRFDAVFIDEVQDTDPIQARIAVLLTRDPDAVGPWDSAPPRAGHLFAVGDEKQSIYRFRRADEATWSALRGIVSQDGETAVLRQNFRSVPGIVAFVNQAFEDLQPGAAQVAARAPGPMAPLVLLRTSEQQDAFDHLVRAVHALRTEGAQIVDRDSGSPRALRWSDVMILVPRWSSAAEIERRLSAAGVPAVVEGGATFFERDEVLLGVSVLRALVEPADAEAVVHVLRGLFGCTHAALAAHVAGGGTWRYTAQESTSGPVSHGLTLLREARRGLHDTLIPGLDMVLDRSGARTVFSLTPGGRSALSNLEKLRVLVRGLEAESRSFAEVVRRLVETRWENTEDDMPVLDDGADAVRVTTIWKAKGLEAGVVVLADMQRRVATGSAIPDRASNTVFVTIGDLTAPGHAEAAEREKVALGQEQRRAMYVAATRARDQLLVAVPPEANLLSHLLGDWAAADAPHGATLEPYEDVRVVVLRGETLPPAPASAETFPGRDRAIDAALTRPGDPAGAPPEPDPFTARRSAHLAAAGRASVSWVAAGALAHEGAGWASGTGIGARGGTLVHRAMERLPLAASVAEASDAAQRLVPALAERAGLSPAQSERVLHVVLRLLRHPALTRLRSAPELWREVPFALHANGRVITGTIDCCFPTDLDRRRWVVLDWKSDAPPAGSPLAAAYQRQVELYARALLASITPCEEVEALVVGPHAELPPDAPDDPAGEEET